MLLPLLTVVVAQAFDLGTFVAMVRRVGPAAEANPLVASLFQDYGTIAVAFAKAVLVLFVVALAVSTARQPRRIRVATAALPVGLAIVAGLVGGISNTAVILG
jgi:hypothetical protein